MIADSDEFIIFEGHLAHLCDGADKVIILRVHPDVLRPRLEARKYSQSKVRENLEAEAMGVCTAEAYEIYGEDVQEIDATELGVEEIVDLISGIIIGEIKLSVGEIDFMDWLISDI
jgi:adenylate kinase